VENITPILHPNTDKETMREWCRDMWARNWGPTLNFAYVIRAIRQALREPNLDGAVNTEFAAVWSESRTEAAKMIKAHIETHCK
jgi:ubiquitin-protein ligase